MSSEAIKELKPVTPAASRVALHQIHEAAEHALRVDAEPSETFYPEMPDYDQCLALAQQIKGWRSQIYDALAKIRNCQWSISNEASKLRIDSPERAALIERAPLVSGSSAGCT